MPDDSEQQESAQRSDPDEAARRTAEEAVTEKSDSDSTSASRSTPDDGAVEIHAERGKPVFSTLPRRKPPQDPPPPPPDESDAG